MKFMFPSLQIPKTGYYIVDMKRDDAGRTYLCRKEAGELVQFPAGRGVGITRISGP